MLLLLGLAEAPCEGATSDLASDLAGVWEDDEGDDVDNVVRSQRAACLAWCCADRVVAGSYQVGAMTQRDAVPFLRTPSLGARGLRGPPEGAIQEEQRGWGG
jgi:hypothetical protein